MKKDCDIRQPTFSVERKRGVSLVQQVCEGLRHDIATGHFQAGSVLPSTRELADMLGVSRIVTRAAVRKLDEEGLINPRVGVGCVVLGKTETRWRGHVLAVLPYGYDTYFPNVMRGIIEGELAAAGYLFTTVVVPEGSQEGFDFTRLDIELTKRYDLVITFYNKSPIFNYLQARGVPYIAMMARKGVTGSAIGSIQIDYNGVVGPFVEACVRGMHRSVLQVSWVKGMSDARPALRKAGLKVKELKISVTTQDGVLHGIQAAALDAFLTRDLSGVDVLFFNDDNLTTGALVALLSRGVKIPDDISVVTWSNYGQTPVFTREMTRMELDPKDAGIRASRACLGYLKTGRWSGDVKIVPTWKVGATLADLTVK